MNRTLGYTTTPARLTSGEAPRRKAPIMLGYVFSAPKESSYPPIAAPRNDPRQMDPEDHEGFTKDQFMTALKAVSRSMAEKAQAAKAKGMLSSEESQKLLDDILNAGG